MYHNYITTASDVTVSETPTLTTDLKMHNSIMETVSSTNDMVMRHQDQYAQDVLIGGALTASVLGMTQVLLTLTVMLLTIAIVNVHKKYNKVIKKQPDVNDV